MTSRRRKLSAILVADVSGFSRLMGANEDGTVDRIQAFQRSARDLVEGFEGRVVDTAGDSVLAEFDSVVNAVGCARRMQESGPGELRARIGIHLGDVIVEDYRVYGDGVNIAARLESIADPGGICISEAVYREIRGKLDLDVKELGLRELKNIEHPIRLYMVPPVRAPEARPEEPKRAVASARTSWLVDAAHPLTLVPACVAAFLVASEQLLFPSAGALPAIGTIVLAVVLGLVFEKRAPGAFLFALGAAIVAAGAWTDWSRITNALFALAGVIVAALGVGRAVRRR